MQLRRFHSKPNPYTRVESKRAAQRGFGAARVHGTSRPDMLIAAALAPSADAPPKPRRSLIEKDHSSSYLREDLLPAASRLPQSNPALALVRFVFGRRMTLPHPARGLTSECPP